MRGLGWIVAAVLGSLTLLVPAASLQAGVRDQTITFDDVAQGAVQPAEFAAEAVTFDVSPIGPDQGGSPIVVSEPYAHSAPNDLELICGDACRTDVWMELSYDVNHFSAWIASTDADNYPMQMTAYDDGGNEVGYTSGTAYSRSFSTQLSLSLPDGATTIRYVDIAPVVPSINEFALDDLSFGPIGSSGPDFGLVQNGSVTVNAGQSASAIFELRRYNESTGNISFSASGLPSGVTASFWPNPDDGGDDSTVTMTLTAAADTPAAVSVPVTVTGVPSRSAGSQSHTVTIPVSVSGNFDLRAQGIEITQGITNAGPLLPESSGQNYPGISLTPPELPASQVSLPSYPGQTPGYGDPLAAGNTTVVRFYADAHGAPPGGVPGVEAQLYGYTSSGAALPGSPLNPDYGPSSLPDTDQADPAPVEQSERTSDANAFTFTLPVSWTQGTINLVAKVSSPFPTFGGPQYNECSTPACAANNSFALNNIMFTQLPWVVIAPLQVRQPSDPALPSSPLAIYQRALLTEPGANQFAVLPYVGTVDPTPEIDADDQANDRPVPPGTPPGTCPSSPAHLVCDRNVNNDYLEAVTDWGAKNLSGGMLSSPHLPVDDLVGVQGTQPGIQDWSIYNEPLNNPAGGGPAEQTANSVNFNRPLTSVGHELGHTLGRNHADVPGPTGCGGNGGPWPPDGKGYIQGIGLDTSLYPYEILAPGLPGEPAQWYDKMSYCAKTNESTANGNLPDAWVSPFGWLHSISALWLFGQRTGRGSTLPSPYSGYQGIEGSLRARGADSGTSHGGAMLLVTGTILPGGAGAIDDLVRSSAPQPAAPASSPFELVARSATGAVIARVPMDATISHGDPGPSVMEVQGAVPASRAHSVSILNAGVTVATRTAPRTKLALSILAPVASTPVGTAGTISVRWRAGGGASIPVTIQYSADGGHHWRGIYSGPNTGSASLPSAYFSASSDARIRIDADDGFQDTVVVSQPFTASGVPPAVTILAPAASTSISYGSSLYLRGEAFDDRLESVAGGHLEWSFGTQVLGHGATISASLLPPGADRITLTAHDYRGRTTSASVVVHVNAAPVRFLKLTPPDSVASTATELPLSAASALPATLHADGRAYALGRKPRLITVAITPGVGPLTLSLSVTARGITDPVLLTIDRTLSLPHPPGPPCGTRCV